VPLSAKRKRNRGYNQSDILAKGVAEITNITIKDKLLLRKDFHGSQTLLNRWRRMENVKDVFLLKEEESLCHKHVLILDDVTTTGATMLACAEAMKHIEGIKISFLSLALTKN
jgi:predicted amidophosphoribosyltransferase